MKKIKLLLAAPTYYPFFGGAEKRFRRYLPLLREYGIESSVFTGTPKAKKISPAHKDESWYVVNHGERLPDEIDQGTDIVRYRLPEAPARKRIGVFHCKLREYIHQYHADIDVIQFLSPFTLSAIKTFKLAKKYNIKTVIACTLIKKPHPVLLKRLLENYRFKKIYSMPDSVVVSSEEVREYVQGRGVDSNIEVIGNGVDTRQYKPVNDAVEKLAIRKQLNIPAHKKTLLSVGTVHPRKGTDLLIRAFERLAKKQDDIVLYIAGPPADEADLSLQDFYQEINQLIASNNLESKVRFLGVVDNVRDYMQAADVFVFPSREEGMGNVVMEAMACGLPVVITPYLGFPSVFGQDGVNYLLAEFSGESIAEKIQEALSSSQSVERMIESSLQNTNENLSVDKSIARFAALYRE